MTLIGWTKSSALVAAVVAACALSTPAPAAVDQTWSPPETLTTIGAEDLSWESTPIARNGRQLAVWSSSDDPVAAHFAHNGSWRSAEALPADVLGLSNLTPLISRTGDRAKLVGATVVDRTLRIRTVSWRSGSWQAPQTPLIVKGVTKSAQWISVAASDDLATGAVTWSSSDSGYVTRWQAGHWSAPKRLGPADLPSRAHDPSATPAVSGDGRSVAVAWVSGNWDVAAKLHVSRWLGSKALGSDTVATDSTIDLFTGGLQLSADGKRGVLAWVGEDQYKNYQVHAAFFSQAGPSGEGRWSKPELIGERKTEAVSLAMSRNGKRALAVWLRSQGRDVRVIEARQWRSGSWRKTVALSPSSTRTRSPSIAMSGDGNRATAIWAVWGGSATGPVQTRRFTDGEWRSTRTLPGPAPGQGATSIVNSPDGETTVAMWSVGTYPEPAYLQSTTSGRG